ncbi:unnamed protein product [Oncorhynchus mykiss]|uniref:G-protein coupled receptors family 1 profile domain-containing protein n=1 Tax=Oncorhynchus mykiss TaxID=8022 RepID=A0A060YSG4_ONCMY|nr:unnamed protein product [Oncorhynchus mykiss]
MENHTYPKNMFLLEGLKVTQQSSYPAFILLLIIYIFTMVSNIGLILLISVERSLHQPMYILFCNLPLNDALGATVIIPRLLSDIFVASADRYINNVACAIQAFCAHMFGTTSHTILIIMAFDRYIAMVCVRNKNRVLNSRALQTCSTHLSVYIIMLVSGFIIIFLHRFPQWADHRKLSAILFHVVPPWLNPIIYGLQTKEIRQKIFHKFQNNKVTVR